MKERHALGQQDVCRWLAGLFMQEVDEQQLQSYFDGAADPLLRFLSQQCSTPGEVAAFEDALTELRKFENPQRVLAVDFASLFLLDGSHNAPPYASFYSGSGNSMLGEPHDRMLARYRANNLSISIASNEPADHIAFMLEYLGLLHSESELDETVQDFVSCELVTWIDLFCDRIIHGKIHSTFYPAISTLTRRYVCSL